MRPEQTPGMSRGGSLPHTGLSDFLRDFNKARKGEPLDVVSATVVESSEAFAPVEKPFLDGVGTLTPEDLGLPFGLLLRQTPEGLSIGREGPKMDESQGLRLFIVPTEELQQFYATHPTADELYKWLKKQNNAGRTVALDGPSIPMPAKDVTVIVKKVEHRPLLAADGKKAVRNRWNIPDIARWEVTPQGIREKLTERVILWDGEAENPLNIAMLLRDAREVRFTEAPFGAYDSMDLEERRQRIVKLGLTKPEQIARLPMGSYEDAELADKRTFSVPETNTVVMLRLREKKQEGGLKVPWFELFMLRGEGGGYQFEIRRRAIGRDRAGFPFYDTGVDGLSINGGSPTTFLTSAEAILAAPIEGGQYQFYTATKNPSMRCQMLRLAVTQTETETHEPVYRVYFLDGVEPGSIVEPLHPSPQATAAREHIFVFAERLAQLKKQKLREQLQEELKKRQADEQAAQRKAEEKARLRNKVRPNRKFFR